MKIFTIFLIFLFSSTNIFANSNDSLMKKIRVKYNYIRANLNLFDITIIEFLLNQQRGGGNKLYL